MILWRKRLNGVQESLRHCKQSRNGVVNASLSARLRRERKADEKTDRFNRMLDLCAAAEDLPGAERIFQRLVMLCFYLSCKHFVFTVCKCCL